MAELLALVLVIIGAASVFWRTDCLITQRHFPDNLPLYWTSPTIRAVSLICGFPFVALGASLFSIHLFGRSSNTTYIAAALGFGFLYTLTFFVASLHSHRRLDERVLVRSIETIDRGRYRGTIYGFEPSFATEHKGLSVGQCVEFEEENVFGCVRS
jgi:hypothetical protein